MSKLQEFRVKKKMSQFELAKLSNVSINSIQRFEQKKNCIDNCHLETLVRIGEILQIPFYELLESDDLSRRVRMQAYSAQPVQHAER